MDYTFHPTLVNPFYLTLMNANFLNPKLIKNTPNFVNDFKQALDSYSDQDLKKMLYDSWRPQKVAAWVIALKKLKKWETDLAVLLLDSVDYAEHLVIAIILLRSEHGAKILEEYLLSQFQKDKVRYDDLDRLSTSLSWAILGHEMLREVSHDHLMSRAELLTQYKALPQKWWSKATAHWANQRADRYPNFQHTLDEYQKEIDDIIQYCVTNFGYSY